MKRFLKIILSLLAVSSLMISCDNEDIITYQPENSAINFSTLTYQFSLKGMTEPTRILTLNVALVGTIADVDRPINVKVAENDSDDKGVEGVDFRLLGGVVKAGELSGTIELEVNKLSAESPRKSVNLVIEPNDCFRAGFPGKSKTLVIWSEEYVRPDEYVWRYWYTYFSKYYSRALHEFYVQQLTEEVEKYTCTRAAAAMEMGFIYKTPFWWYTASRLLRDAVQEYDKNHPDAPLMHSSDCMRYGSYTVTDGAGERPTTIPTILETLISL